MTTILIVDDSHLTRGLLRNYLTDFRFSTLEAKNGVIAEEMLKQHHSIIDLILLDIIMPQQDGIATLQKVRKNHSDIPVIMLTGHSDKAIIMKCIKIGIQGFVSKPFEMKDLYLKICEVLNIDSKKQLLF